MNILDYLERTEAEYGSRTAVEEADSSLSWTELVCMARKIGGTLSRRTLPGSPVPVLSEKSPATLAAMLGAVYAGCFYVPVNVGNPRERLAQIMDKLEPDVIIADEKGRAALGECSDEDGARNTVCTAEELLDDSEEGDLERLEAIRERSGGSDLLYGIFTSGSTGTPKAIVVSHQSVITFIRHFTELFDIGEKDVIGNQAPFDFDVSVKDIYSSMFTGARLVLIPKEYFSTPPRLLDYLCEKEVTNLTWAVSALTLVSGLKGLDYRVPERVRRVMFSGESMPPKHLRIWQEHLPDARFVNLYGPTEITCNCTYFPVERMYSDEEKLPAGKAFPERTVFLMDAEGRRIEEAGTVGEICVAGTSLAEGYYRDPEQTARHFVTCTLGGKEERVYKTGDMGMLDEEGNLIFAGRKDFQIKHMGHRIELEEIERAMCGMEGILQSCCVFLPEKNRIFGFYMGEAEPQEVRLWMKERLPVYMIPAKLVKTDHMPLNKNGKTDRDYFRRLALSGRREK